MKKNIFIVRSPLQIINAIEAREHFKLQNTVLVMMLDKAECLNADQMRDALKISAWDEVISYQPQQKASSLSEQVQLIKRLKKDEYDYMFSGDFGTVNKIMMANLNAKEIFLIDDGTATIVIHQKLFEKQSAPLRKKAKLLRYRLFGLKSRIKNTINFFTCYDLKSIKDEQIVENSYQYMQKKYLKELEQDNKTYVLGQNLTQVKFMDDKTYVSYVKKIISHYSGEIIYIPHRTEIISESLRGLFNERFKLQMTEGPIELVFLKDAIYPSRVISFVSSALFTLNKIFSKAEVNAIKIDENDLKLGQENIKICYTFFDNTSVKVVTLEDEKGQ